MTMLEIELAKAHIGVLLEDAARYRRRRGRPTK